MRRQPDKDSRPSVVRRMLIYPLTVYLLFVALTVAACVASFTADYRRQTDTYVGAARVGLQILESGLDQLDDAFVSYWMNDESYRRLAAVNLKTPKSQYIVWQAAAHQWLANVSYNYLCNNGGGAFAFFPNAELYLFRGDANAAVRAWITENAFDREIYDQWELEEINGQQWMIKIRRYNNFLGGVWLDMDQVRSAAEPEIEAEVEVAWFDLHTRPSAVRGVRYVTGSKGIGMRISYPVRSYLNQLPVTYVVMLMAAALSFLMIPVVILWMLHNVAQPIRDLEGAMKNISEGDMEYRLSVRPEEPEDEFDRLKSGFNTMMDDINALEQKLYVSKIQEQRTHLKYISQQIRPHFILNALNLLYQYEPEEYEQSKKLITCLIEYFRYITYLRADFVELAQEMRHIKNYLQIQKERYGDAFDYFVEWSSAAAGVRIPPLIIQTFAENCIKYGQAKDGLFFVYVLADIEGDHMKLMIADSGDGFPEEKLAALKQFTETRVYDDSLGVGIQNAVERMDLLYEQKIDIYIYNGEYGGAVVEIHIPLTL